VFVHLTPETHWEQETQRTMGHESPDERLRMCVEADVH
jgi:hypothetical protein